MTIDPEERILLADAAILEMLLEERLDGQGQLSDRAQRVLLGEAEPLPEDLLEKLRQARRDLTLYRQNAVLNRMVGALQALFDRGEELPEELSQRMGQLLEQRVESKDTCSREVLTVDEAARLMGVGRKTLQNRVSEMRRAGKRLDWVLPAGRKRGFMVHRERFLRWMQKQPRRRGRPPATPP